MKTIFSVARRQIWPLSLLALVSAYIVGCTAPTRLEHLGVISKSGVTQMQDAEFMLSYVLQTRRLSPTEFALEKERVRAEFIGDKSSYKRVKLAILLALSPAPSTPAVAASEEVELLMLVEPLALTANGSLPSTEPTLQALATLLLMQAQERKRLREQWRESVVRSNLSRRDELNAQTEARILRIQVDDLEKKLNAMKSIERSVTSRGAEGSAK